MRKLSNFHDFISFECPSVGFDNSWVSIGSFLKFWRNPEIQDGGSNVAASWKS